MSLFDADVYDIAMLIQKVAKSSSKRFANLYLKSQAFNVILSVRFRHISVNIDWRSLTHMNRRFWNRICQLASASKSEWKWNLLDFVFDLVHIDTGIVGRLVVLAMATGIQQDFVISVLFGIKHVVAFWTELDANELWPTGLLLHHRCFKEAHNFTWRGNKTSRKLIFHFKWTKQSL